MTIGAADKPLKCLLLLVNVTEPGERKRKKRDGTIACLSLCECIRQCVATAAFSCACTPRKLFIVNASSFGMTWFESSCISSCCEHNIHKLISGLFTHVIQDLSRLQTGAILTYDCGLWANSRTGSRVVRHFAVWHVVDNLLTHARAA